MLTATYTLVALSVEQASVRVSLLAFQHYVRSTLMPQNRISLRQLEYACATLDQLYQACHWRKIEMYLIPAIRAATERADQLLDELGRLNQSALGVIRALQQRLGDGDQLQTQVAQTCAGIETFCAALLQRLEKEEKELFAIARRVIGGEAWFAIAHQFMVHDARVEEQRRARPVAGPKTALSVWPGHACAAAPALGAAAATTASADAIAADDDDGDAIPRDAAGLEPAIPGLVALPIPGAAALPGVAPYCPRREGVAGRATAE